MGPGPAAGPMQNGENLKKNDPTATEIQEEGPRTHRKQQKDKRGRPGEENVFSPGASFSGE